MSIEKADPAEFIDIVNKVDAIKAAHPVIMKKEPDISSGLDKVKDRAKSLYNELTGQYRGSALGKNKEGTD